MNKKESHYCSQLIIGSAQFGFDYGVTNYQGMVPVDEMINILDYSWNHDIHTIDTARFYGQSEKNLGNYKHNRFDIISKFSKIPKGASSEEIEDYVRESLRSSRENLEVSTLHGLLAHDVNEFLEHHKVLCPLGVKLKKEGLIKKFGVSLYNPDQAQKVLDIFTPDIIQFPMNVFDQRFVESGILKKMHDRGIEKHVRSVFLQGIILQEASNLDPFFDFFRPFYTKYQEFIADTGLNPLMAALKFTLDNPYIDKTIIGVCSLEQIKDITTSLLRLEGIQFVDFSSWKFHDDRLINPLSWPMLKK